jgi:uncharacterized membrane protein
VALVGKTLALEILDDRFAWGEIDRADYEGRKSALKAGAR